MSFDPRTQPLVGMANQMTMANPPGAAKSNPPPSGQFLVDPQGNFILDPQGNKIIAPTPGP